MAEGGRARGAADSRVLAARLADAVVARRPAFRSRWAWEDGMLLRAVDDVGRALPSAALRSWAAAAVGCLLDGEGRISGIEAEEGDLGRLQAGLPLASLPEAGGGSRFRGALGQLREALLRQPRTRAGGFWSRRDRPFQMWLDGTSAPLHARCLAALGEGEELEDAVHQLLLVEERARDPRSGLPVHAWDESRRQLWSNHESGRSATAWSRAVGWFAAAAVDTFVVLPPGHPGREPVRAMLTRFAGAAARWQDPVTGMWWQVTDQPGRDGNFPEASGTCLLAWALARGSRVGCIRDAGAAPAAARALEGVRRVFVREDDAGRKFIIPWLDMKYALGRERA